MKGFHAVFFKFKFFDRCHGGIFMEINITGPVNGASGPAKANRVSGDGLRDVFHAHPNAKGGSQVRGISLQELRADQCFVGGNRNSSTNDQHDDHESFQYVQRRFHV